MKYRCLIFDHDDTTVNSTTMIHYPSFVAFMKEYRPEIIFGWEEPKEERKPPPLQVLKIMEKYALKPEEVLVIDDLKPGLDMARAAIFLRSPLLQVFLTPAL